MSDLIAGTDVQDRYARYDRATADLDPPFAVVDLAAFDSNARDLVRRSGGVPIRVVSKSLRCRHLIERALAQPGYRGVMCYSLTEAIWLHSIGLSDDLLVAYPTADRSALRALAADEAARQHITVTIDSARHLDFIDAAIGAGHPQIRVCLDLDMSWRPLTRGPVVQIGTWRSPLRSPAEAALFAETVLKRPGFSLVGVLGYEGQIAGLGDAPPGRPVRAALVQAMQARSSAELNERRTEVVRRIRALAPLEFVNGGGTGSLESTSGDKSVTELAAGPRPGGLRPGRPHPVRRVPEVPPPAGPAVRAAGGAAAQGGGGHPLQRRLRGFRDRDAGPAAVPGPAGRPAADQDRGRRRGADPGAGAGRGPAQDRRPGVDAARQGRRAGRAAHPLLPDKPGRASCRQRSHLPWGRA